jgi:hypothetical protein
MAFRFYHALNITYAPADCFSYLNCLSRFIMSYMVPLICRITITFRYVPTSSRLNHYLSRLPLQGHLE